MTELPEYLKDLKKEAETCVNSELLKWDREMLIFYINQQADSILHLIDDFQKLLDERAKMIEILMQLLSYAESDSMDISWNVYKEARALLAKLKGEV